MDAGFLARLRADRQEILSVARTLGSAEEMRKARSELVALADVHVAPRTDEERANLYAIDEAGDAHIPIVGELTPRAQTDACGAYTAEALTEYGYIIAASQAADADDNVSAVVFDVDSPGGYVDGLDAAAQAMARIKKPTEARVHGMAASAAYWLASQADQIVAASPAVQVGSIGVAAEEFDEDEYLAKHGVVHRVYTSTDAPDKRPDTSTPEGQAKIVAQLDALHKVFVSRVAEGRNVTPKKVNEDFGRGGVLIARDALAAGMIDHIEGVSIARPKNAGVASSAAATSAAISSKEVHMDLNTLKAEHPEVYKAALAVGFEDGVKAEQSRREKMEAYLGINADGDKAIKDSIASGKSYEDCQASIQAAILRGNSKNADGENPPDAKSKAQPTGSGVDLTAEDFEAAKLAGMDPDEYRKFSKKKEA